MQRMQSDLSTELESKMKKKNAKITSNTVSKWEDPDVQ